jgi:hypothetical protein
LFLDELPGLSSGLQAKVLKAIEDHHIRRKLVGEMTLFQRHGAPANVPAINRWLNRGLARPARVGILHAVWLCILNFQLRLTRR